MFIDYKITISSTLLHIVYIKEQEEDLMYCIHGTGANSTEYNDNIINCHVYSSAVIILTMHTNGRHYYYVGQTERECTYIHILLCKKVTEIHVTCNRYYVLDYRTSETYLYI